MSSASLRDLVIGPPAYRTLGGWTALWALPATLAIFVSAQLLAGVAYGWIIASDLGWLRNQQGTEITQAIIIILFLAQIGVVLLTVLAASLPNGRPMQTLCLVPPVGGWRMLVLAILAMLPLLAAINGVAYVLRRDDFLADFRLFLEAIRSDRPIVTALAIGIGAPLSEELLFRGFLLSALAASRLGFWRSALLVTLAWTLLHWGYSVAGLLEIFAIGMFFSWLLWRTGSLWVPLFCHALYNSCLFLILRFLVLSP